MSGALQHWSLFPVLLRESSLLLHSLLSGPGVKIKLTSQGLSSTSNVQGAGLTPIINEPHDLSVDISYTTSLQQRQQQAQAFYRTQQPSRPSSSSGSAPHSLRRTPNLEEQASRRRASFDSLPRPAPTVRFSEETQVPANSSRPRSSSSLFGAPHPALRISRRTASAILFALEEAIRTPNAFTPDLAEENSSMSELLGTPGGGNGRSANGRTRAATGPLPATGTPSRTMPGVPTPQEVLRSRVARKEAAEEEARAAAQRAQDEERRRSAERRAQAAGVAGTSQPQRSSVTATTRPYDSGYGTLGGDSRTQTGQGSSSRPQDNTTGPPGPRARTASQSQSQPRPAQTTASAATQPPTGPLPSQPRPSQTHSRQASGAQQPASTGQMPSTSGGAEGARTRTSNVSSFPHAFERWETLSSHWEGLTSYWIRRLEQNTEEVRREPLAQQMSRQITDLSAAGANLFHAVVELQRLRASSERKFQRWFFETRQEQEKMQEQHADIERALAAERAARVEAERRAETAERAQQGNNKKNSEIQRELQIAKQEARRAWEELGRREQEERDRTASLREGRATLVGGVQVVPMPASMSRQGSNSQRPSTQEREQQIQPQYSYESQSPTDTDPYASAAVRGAGSALRSDAGAAMEQGLYSYPAASTPATSSSTHTAIPATEPSTSRAPTQTHIATSQAQQLQQPPPTSEPSSPERFYTHAGTYLDTQSGAAYRPIQSTAPATQAGADDYPSVASSELSEEDFEYDAQGNVVVDSHGAPIRYTQGRSSLDSGDSYDVHSDIAREREHQARYGTQPPTSSAGYPTTSSAPDYEGAGYGSGGYDQWAGIQRHHHPTRLSDVLEEDERSQISHGTRSVVSRRERGEGSGYPSER